MNVSVISVSWNQTLTGESPGDEREPYDERAAEWHGEERARLERAGKVAPFVDGQIAAIAATRAVPLVTANTADFKYFKEVVVQSWIRIR